jgi:predicted nuclease of predicted toxin-antitoxin system
MTVQLRFLADMNLSPLTVEDLRKDGYDVIRVSSLLPVNASDAEILELARRQTMVVITQDLDFSVLLALSGYDRPSLVTLRLTNTDPNVVTQWLRRVLPQIGKPLSEGNAVTVDDKTVRIRKLPIR